MWRTCNKLPITQIQSTHLILIFQGAFLEGGGNAMSTSLKRHNARRPFHSRPQPANRYFKWCTCYELWRWPIITPVAWANSFGACGDSSILHMNRSFLSRDSGGKDESSCQMNRDLHSFLPLLCPLDEGIGYYGSTNGFYKSNGWIFYINPLPWVASQMELLYDRYNIEGVPIAEHLVKVIDWVGKSLDKVDALDSLLGKAWFPSDLWWYMNIYQGVLHSVPTSCLTMVYPAMQWLLPINCGRPLHLPGHTISVHSL